MPPFVMVSTNYLKYIVVRLQVWSFITMTKQMTTGVIEINQKHTLQFCIA